MSITQRPAHQWHIECLQTCPADRGMRHPFLVHVVLGENAPTPTGPPLTLQRGVLDVEGVSWMEVHCLHPIKTYTCVLISCMNTRYEHSSVTLGCRSPAVFPRVNPGTVLLFDVVGRHAVRIHRLPGLFKPTAVLQEESCPRSVEA